MKSADDERVELSPFHAGERAYQERAGVRERIEQMGRRMIRDFMPDQHRELFAELPWLVVGSVSDGGQPWASVLVGQPGFVSSPDPRELGIDAAVGHGDPLAAALRPGRSLGILGIQPETRRRNRVNGTVSAVDERGFRVQVVQSFGNCPKYIHTRTPVFVADPRSVALVRPVERERALLSPEACAMIEQADTFFIASATSARPERAGDPAQGVDVSHRGGPPGFVRVEEVSGRSVLSTPDYVGNSMFNTLGNLALYPRAGLTFVDFASGDLLMLSGATEVLWEGPELRTFADAKRVLRVTVEAGVRIPGALPLRWT